MEPALTILQKGEQPLAQFTDSSNITAFTITSTSYVGIGTSLPQEKLHVNGTVSSTNLTVGDITYAYVPRGLISMWSGSIAAIPLGWAICNGLNGTPDLRDRFVIGAGSIYAVGATGGATSVTLAIANLPAHSHTGTTVAGGDHNHGGATGAEGDHSHGGLTGNVGNHTHTVSGTTGAGGDHNHTANTGGGGSHDHTVYIAVDVYGSGDRITGDNTSGTDEGVYTAKEAGITSVEPNHTHTVSVGNSGNHTHSFSATSSAGGSHNHSISASGTHTHSISSSGNHTHTFTTDTTGSGTAFSTMPPYLALAYIMKL